MSYHINFLKNVYILLAFILPFMAKGISQDLYFEGGPSLYDLLYTKVSPLSAKAPSTSSREDIRKNISLWMASFQKRGVTLFSIPLFDREGVIICDSPSLKSAGFRYIQEVEDIFPWILIEAKRNGLALNIPLDDIAHIIHGTKLYKEWINPSKLDTDAIASFIKELGDYSKAYQVKLWVNEQCFGQRYLPILSQACKENGIGYIRYSSDYQGYGDIFCSEDYATYPASPESQNEDADYLYNLSRWGTASGRLGHLNLMFGLANTMKKRTGVLTAGGWGLKPGCQFNVALYRTVQFSPGLYCFCSAFYDQPPYENKEDSIFVKNFHYTEKLLPFIRKFSRVPQDTTKPIANIILDPPDPPFHKKGMDIFENALSSSMEATTNAIGSAGMELFVSVKEPVPNASVYYIFTAGSSPQLDLYSDISTPVSNLITSIQTSEASLNPISKKDQPQIYLQCALGLPRGAKWKNVAQLFGLPAENVPKIFPSDKPLASPIPLEAHYQFPTGTFPVKFRGYQFWIDKREEAGRDFSYHHFIDIPNNDSNSVILEGKEGDTRFPLVIRQNNHFFIAANFVHFHFSNLLCNWMSPNPIFYRPGFIYLTTGKERSAIFASADTEIDLSLPQSSSSQIYHWEADGNSCPVSSVEWKEGRLQGKLKKWELVIVQ